MAVLVFDNGDRGVRSACPPARVRPSPREESSRHAEDAAPLGQSAAVSDEAERQWQDALELYVERCLCSLHQRPAALDIRRQGAPECRCARLVERTLLNSFLTSRGGATDASRAPPSAVSPVSRSEATHRVPQQADVRRIGHVRLDDERITPPA